jgi:phosphoserine phosphatase
VRLLVLDVEGTLFRTAVRLPGALIDSTVWQALAQLLGTAAVLEEVETHRKWQAGQYRNYLNWMEETIDIHQRHGLTESHFRSVIEAAEYNAGVASALSRIDRQAYEIVLISGGFRELAQRAQRDFQIRHAFAACEYFFSPDGLLCGYNLLPCDFEGKLSFIQLMLREYRLDASAWVFVGDGQNDVPIAKAAPFSIGYKAHPDLAEVCSRNISDFEDVVAILSTRGEDVGSRQETRGNHARI